MIWLTASNAEAWVWVISSLSGSVAPSLLRLVYRRKSHRIERELFVRGDEFF
jgi:hypothetical protein